MWLLSGIGALILTVFNLVFYFKGKDNKPYMVLAFALTGLTACAEYKPQSFSWGMLINREGIWNVIPHMSVWIWAFIALLLILNLIPVVKTRFSKK